MVVSSHSGPGAAPVTAFVLRRARLDIVRTLANCRSSLLNGRGGTPLVLGRRLDSGLDLGHKWDAKLSVWNQELGRTARIESTESTSNGRGERI